MNHLLLFEAFGSKNISAIQKFLNQLDKQDAKEFIDMLKNMSRSSDIPLSLFKGEYISAIKAIKHYKEDEKIVKFWFSVKEGLIGTTITKQYTGRLDKSWMTDFAKEFIMINVPCSESLYTSEWSEDKYKKIIESEFALIINLSELKKGLKDLVVKRKEARKGATALYSDEYIRLSNKRKRSDILQQKRGVSDSEIDDFIYDIAKKHRCYDPFDMLDVIHELYFRGKITKIMFESSLKFIEDRFSRFFDRFGGSGYGSIASNFGGSSFFRRRRSHYGYDRYDDYGYDDF